MLKLRAMVINSRVVFSYILQCDDWLLCGIVLRILHFSRHFHSYVVDKTDKQIAFGAGSELTFHCLDVRQIGRQSYVRFRYEVSKLWILPPIT